MKINIPKEWICNRADREEGLEIGAGADLRYVSMRIRFKALTSAALIEMLRHIDITLFDTYNYHAGKFCPMGIALGCHKSEIFANDAAVKWLIAKNGFFPTNILKDVPGEFYHGTDAERKRDLISLVCEILRERALRARASESNSANDQHPASRHLSDRPKLNSLCAQTEPSSEPLPTREELLELQNQIEAAPSQEQS